MHNAVKLSPFPNPLAGTSKLPSLNQSQALPCVRLLSFLIRELIQLKPQEKISKFKQHLVNIVDFKEK